MTKRDDTIDVIVKFLSPFKPGLSEQNVQDGVSDSLKTLDRAAVAAKSMPSAKDARDSAHDLSKKLDAVIASLRIFPLWYDYRVFGPLDYGNTKNRISRQDFIKTVRSVRDSALAMGKLTVPRGSPRQDVRQPVCADCAHYLMRNFSATKIYSYEGSPFRLIASALFEYLTDKTSKNEMQIDLKRACDSYLR